VGEAVGGAAGRRRRRREMMPRGKKIPVGSSTRRNEWR